MDEVGRSMMFVSESHRSIIDRYRTRSPTFPRAQQTCKVIVSNHPHLEKRTMGDWLGKTNQWERLIVHLAPRYHLYGFCPM